ncbi:uncharacterized protein LOC142872885 [Microcebus murinus]|uniref:uncharacterized protein LOC142872885 n=1 Tax=Microcebus murinus TaxID=30608 RepID=UPI003F6A7559
MVPDKGERPLCRWQADALEGRRSEPDGDVLWLREDSGTGFAARGGGQEEFGERKSGPGNLRRGAEEDLRATIRGRPALAKGPRCVICRRILTLEASALGQCRTAPTISEATAPQQSAVGGEEGPAYGTRQRTGRTPNPEPVKTFPLRAVGPRGEDGTQNYQYWPFSTSDLYNWKAQNSNFSDNPRDLINLLDSVLFTHQPTWDDCQQLLKVLFTTEERERIQGEARKLVPGEDGRPTTNPRTIDRVFPLERPPWDYNEAEGKERLRVYRQTLMAGLRMAARKPTNLAKVGDVRQGPEESPAAYLERIMEAFRQYSPIDPTSEESKAAVMMAFVNQAASDRR